MTGRSPLRLLAPLALVVVAIALIAVVGSGGSDDSSSASSSGGPASTATATPTARRTPRPKPKHTYTVQSGDTPSSIAAAHHINVADLLAANPDVSPSALHVGQKLKLP